jgi:hypothetical protein
VFSLTVVILCAVALASCTGKRERGWPQAKPAPSADAPSGSKPTQAPAPASPTVPAEEPAEAKAVPEPPPEVDADPARLMGLDGTALTALLGKPRFIRKDFQVELWRYRHESCTLELYLYPEGKGEAPSYRVEHIGARGNNGGAMTTEHCLRALLIERALAASPG